MAVSPRSHLCPPDWLGIVVLGDAALATAPDHHTAGLAEQALSDLPAASLTDTDLLSKRLPVAEMLGPAALAYLDSADFRRQPGDGVCPKDSPARITADHYEDGGADMRMAVASPVRRPPSPGEPVSVYLRLSPVFARDPLGEQPGYLERPV
jgi:hypothetical protein